MAIRVLLVDDHAIFRAGLRSLLGADEEIDVVGEAADGRSAVELCRDLAPDVVVMDVTMPELNGVDAARRILERNPRIRVVGLSMHTEPRFVAAMLRAGAAGHLAKASAPAELSVAIRAVAAGRRYLSPKVDTPDLRVYLEEAAGKRAPKLLTLSSREREVLQLLAEGKSLGQMAILLQVGTATVETYRRRLMGKLGLTSLADLIKYAVREGLTTNDP